MTGSPAYFSLDGGATDLANFDATNADPSDWAQGGPDDANLAISYLGVANNFGQVDLRELNALGFQRVAQTDDFEGKGTSDIIWRNATTGALWEWQFANGAVASGVYLGANSSYQIAGAGDFNGDGTTDLLWTNPSTGDAWTWQMSNGRLSAGPSSGQSLRLERDHRPFQRRQRFRHPLAERVDRRDLRLENAERPGRQTSYLGVQSGWTVIGAGDFNADGTTDVLLENGAGQVWDWMMSNDAYVGAHNLGNVAGWSLIGSGDFNGDRTTDLLWRNNASHDVVEWLMANGLVHSTVNLGAVSGANVVATGDYFATGTSDIVWQNTSTGATTLWAMQNGQHMSAYDVNLGRSSGLQGSLSPHDFARFDELRSPRPEPRTHGALRGGAVRPALGARGDLARSDGGESFRSPAGGFPGRCSTAKSSTMARIGRSSRPDGVALIDTRYLLRLDDGALAYLRTRGFRHGPAEVIAALARGRARRSRALLFPRDHAVRDRLAALRLAEPHHRPRRRDAAGRCGRV